MTSVKSGSFDKTDDMYYRILGKFGHEHGNNIL